MRTQDATAARPRPGAAAIELALLLPVLALMFAATVDFARVFHATQALETAAQVGATYATGTAQSPGTTADMADAARAAACAEGACLTPPLGAGGVTVTTAGGMTTVSVEYDYPLLTAVLMPAATVHLQRTVTMRTAPRPGD